MMVEGQTPPQTIGPFFHRALEAPPTVESSAAGDGLATIQIRGRILDGRGAAVDDALVERWQADELGRYRHPADPRHRQVSPDFIGFGRVATEPDGSYRFLTVLPGPVDLPGHPTHAPHVNLQIFARGLLDKLCTRIYFSSFQLNDQDPVLASLPASRRATLLATLDSSPTSERDAVTSYRFDIRLQGEGETVFFDV